MPLNRRLKALAGSKNIKVSDNKQMTRSNGAARKTITKSIDFPRREQALNILKDYQMCCAMHWIYMGSHASRMAEKPAEQ